jgi:hypothetical protein
VGERFIILSPLLKDLEKRKQFVDEYRKTYAGANNAYKDRFLVNGTEVKETGNDPDKSQLVESREHDLIQIADLLNVPPHKLGASISTSYSSLQSENQAFLDDCLDFWLVSWTQEVEAKLLTEREKEGDLRQVDFDRTELLRMDPQTEGELRISKLNNGVISWEEARSQEDLAPDKDDAQQWRHPANIVIEGDEPPDPPTQAPPMPLQPVAVQSQQPPVTPVESEDKAKRMARGIFERWHTRLSKSVKQSCDLDDHRAILINHLGAFEGIERFADSLISDLKAEWEAVLPEQRNGIWENHDTSKLLEALWTTQ